MSSARSLKNASPSRVFVSNADGRVRSARFSRSSPFSAARKNLNEKKALVRTAAVSKKSSASPSRQLSSRRLELEREKESAERELKALFDEKKPPPPASAVAQLRNKISSLEVKQKELEENAVQEMKVNELKKLQKASEALQKAVMSKSTKKGSKLNAEDVGKMADAVEDENNALREILEIRQEELGRQRETSQIEVLELENQKLHRKLEALLSREKTLLELSHENMKEQITVSDEQVELHLQEIASEEEEATDVVESSESGPPEEDIVEERDDVSLNEVEASSAENQEEEDEEEHITEEDIWGDDDVGEEEEEEVVEVVASNEPQLVEEDVPPIQAFDEGVMDAYLDIHLDEGLKNLVSQYEEGERLRRAELALQIEESNAVSLREYEAFQTDRESYLREREGNTVCTVPPTSAVSGSEVCILLNREKATQLGASINVDDLILQARYNENQIQEHYHIAEEVKTQAGDWLMWKVEIPAHVYDMKYDFFDSSDWYLKNEEHFVLECLTQLSKEQCLAEMKLIHLQKFTKEKERLLAMAPQVSTKGGAPKSFDDDIRSKVQGIRDATMGLYNAAKIDVDDSWYIEGIAEPGKVVTLFYDAAAGHLAGCGNLVLHWGCNAWSTKGFENLFEEEAASGGGSEKGGKAEWHSVSIEIPKHAVVLDFVVSSNGRYDNNLGLDYHFPVDREENLQEFWAKQIEVEIEREGKAIEERAKQEALIKQEKKKEVEVFMAKASEKLVKRQQEIVSTDPPAPRAGKSLTLVFNVAASNLPESDSIEVAISFNRGSHPLKCSRTQMKRTEDGLFEVALPTPSDAYMMDVKFYGSYDSLDDHAGFGYHIPLEKSKVPESPQHIVHVAVEMAPVAKVGGLGDVVTSIGRAVQDMGNIVEVVLPKYDTINYDKVKGFHEIESFDWGGCTNRVFTGLVEDVQVYFIQPGNGFFDIGMIYGADWEDFPMMDSERFGFFSKAALEFMLQSGRQPDIIHCHDWSAALVAKSYWDDYNQYGLPHSSIVFTIHNMGYGQDLIAQAMQFSQKATTVSPTYAQEIVHEGPIQHSQHKFHGIRNGIDIEIWNASDDKHLPMGYDSSNSEEGKARAKRSLKDYVNLKNVDVPLVGIVSRLTLQKGVELMEHAIWTALDRGCQVVVLGSAFDEEMTQRWNEIELSLRHQHHDMARLIFAYNEPLSHLIYGGCDMILVPSMFEPCGLTQLIAMRYGTIPIVRHTGGLRDTVFDIDFDQERAKAQGIETNGFAFEGNDTGGMDYALHRAIDAWYNDKAFWNSLVSRVMDQDWSWSEPALTYLALYYAAKER